ncbi:MAG: polymer-forming cytoskeletal protein [Chitinophagaceae bacterium]|nr:polymer-forming cytoskeletal protein [Chitinophagaceae bacterium]
MFNSKSKNSFNESSAGAATIIGAGTVISGNIESNGDVRVDGKIIGNISAKAKVLVGPEGVVEGDIFGQHADVLGKVNGIIKVNDLLHLRGKGIIDGDIYAGQLQIEPSATFNGQCHMGANIVELHSERANVVNQ